MVKYFEKKYLDFGLDQDLLYWRKTKNSLSSSIVQS